MVKVIVEYLIRKKMVIETDFFDDASIELSKKDWINTGKVINKKPEIVSKILKDVGFDKPLTLNEKNFGVEEKKLPTYNIKTKEDWWEIFKHKVNKILEDKPWWTMEKCKYVAKKEMPNMPKE